MQIEFMGCTGAGKTTLISALHSRLAKTEEVRTSFDLIAAPVGLRRVTNPTMRNLIQEFLGFPYIICSLHRHMTFLIFTLKMLARHSPFNFRTINYLRSLERTLGVYEIIRRHQRDQIIIVDEGTIVPAHNLFVYTDADYTSAEISRYATLAPLPDLLIYIKAPIDILIQRSLKRSDPPREMGSKIRTLIEKYIHRAVAMFDQLVEVDRIRARTLVVENPEATDQGRDAVVNKIVQFILNRQLVG